MKIQVLKNIDGLLGPLLARILPRPAPSNLVDLSSGRILFIRPGGIGDAVLLIPALLEFNAAFPGVAVDILAEQRNAGAFELYEGNVNVFRYDKPADLVSVLRTRYDVVVDTEQWHRLSAIIARLVRSHVKIGFSTNERQRLLTHPVSYSHEAYEANSFLQLLEPLGVEKVFSEELIFLSVPAEVASRVKELLEPIEHRPYVALFPGASIPERCWGIEKYHQLAIRFIEEGFSVVVVGGKDDSTAGRSILEGTCGLTLAGETSLAETAGVLSGSRLLVSGDSGVLHMGVGLGVPTVSLFGPGIARKWAPRGALHRVINQELPCSPCTRFGYTPQCKIGACCISDISVVEVFAAAQAQLRKISQEG